MTEKSFVVLVNVIIDNCLLTTLFHCHRLQETGYNLFQYRLVKYHLLSIHDGLHIGRSQQFTGLQDDAYCPSPKRIHPKFLVQNFSGENKHLQLRTFPMKTGANLHANGGRTSQPQVKQHHIGRTCLHQFPELFLGHGRTNDLRIRYFVTENFFRSL